MTININDFLIDFEQEYEYLYDNDDNVAGFDEAVEAFDNFVREHTEFIGDFVRFRGDFISSDREAAAFMFTLESYR